MKQFLESSDFLQTVIAEAEKNNETARRLVAGLSEEQLSWTSAPGSWSIAQCLDHLAVTSAKFNAYFASRTRSRPEKLAGNFCDSLSPSFVGGWLIKQVVPETTRKFPAPKVFQPSQSQAVPGAFEKFLKQQAEFMSYVRDARGIDYNKIRLRSPVTALMRYSLADAFVVTVVHGWRHLAQAQRMRDTPGFPTN